MSFGYKTSLTSSVIVTALYIIKLVNGRTAFPVIGRSKGQVVLDILTLLIMTCSYE